MVKVCCVKGCRSESFANCGISFHKFPKDGDLRAKWQEALAVTNIREHKLVCSLHFKHEHFTEHTTLKRLKPDVVPYKIKPEEDCDVKSSVSDAESIADSDCTYVPPSPGSNDCEEIKISPPSEQTGVASQTEGVLTAMLPVTTKYSMCRICLATDRELFHMSERDILEQYQQLIGAQVGESRPQHVCWECARRLSVYSRFRNRALQANALLQTLPTENSYMLISNKLKEHFSSKLEVIQTKILADFEFTFSTPRQGLYSFKDNDEESIDESIYLEIDELDIKDYETFENTINKKSDEMALENENITKLDKEILSMETRKTNSSNGVLVRGNKNKTTLSDRSIFRTSELTRKSVRKNTKKIENTEDIVLNADIIDVKELSHDEQKACLIQRRESLEFKKAKFKCMECYKGYMDEDVFNLHVSQHDIKHGAHVCEVCRVRFSRAVLLQQHVRVEHATQYTCARCTFLTNNRLYAKQHEGFHTDGTFQCPYCPQAFASSCRYFGHVRARHPPDRACARCGYMFLGEAGLHAHNIIKHKLDEAPLEGPYCEVCDLKFATEEAYDRHLRLSSKHTTSDQDPNSIPSYPPLLAKRKYLFPPRAASRLECEQCGVRVLNTRSYSQHVRRAHPHASHAPHARKKTGCMCEQCGKIFPSPGLLRQHTWVHSGRGKPYSCSLCGQAFTAKSSLHSHERAQHAARTDRADRTHACPDCGNTFQYRHNMLKHMFIHTGLRPFECESCGKCFRTVHQRQAHFDHVHLHKPWPHRPHRYRAKRAKREPED